MRNEYDKEINNDAISSGREMIFGNIDSLPAVAVINTVLVFATIHHIRKMKIGNRK